MQNNYCNPNEKDLQEIIKTALIGKNDYHQKQIEVFKALDDKKNVMGVFATGRGKSAIFQAIAAFKALTENKITIILYPFKSLINDQLQSLKRDLEPLGLRVLKGAGDLSKPEKDAFFHDIEYNNVDIILANPDFLNYHLQKFEDVLQRVDFMVLDEAHHISDNREGYKKIEEILAFLQNPQVIALTATADDEITEEICQRLNIDEVIIDEHTRKNLELFDLRDGFLSFTEKVNHIAVHVGLAKGKSIVYVLTRADAERYAKELNTHRDVHALFYHAGMEPEEKLRVEKEFSEGDCNVICSTSAFGEGVNIKYAEYVFMTAYHFSIAELNQEAGRAGRNGQHANIHLLTNKSDKKIIRQMLLSLYPDYNKVKSVYDTIQILGMLDANLILIFLEGNWFPRIRLDLVETALSILRELEIITSDGKIVINKRFDYQLCLKSRTFRNCLKKLDDYEDYCKTIEKGSRQLWQDIIQSPISPVGNHPYKWYYN